MARLTKGAGEGEGRRNHKSPLSKMACRLSSKRHEKSLDSPIIRQYVDPDLSLHTDVTESTLDPSLQGSLNSIRASSLIDANEESIVPDADDTTASPEQPQRALSGGPIASAEKSGQQQQALEPPRVKKSVYFSKIEINHHAVILGDNPSVSSGPPLALGNKLLHMDSISVSDYEACRPPRREKFEMALPRMMREDMLKEEGYSRADFRDAEMEIRKIKKNRQASAAATLWEKVRYAAKSRRVLQNIDSPLVA